MSKKRTIQQKSEAESKGKLMDLLSTWIVNPLENDFGIDFEVRITENFDSKTQKVSDLSFYIQNKSIINFQNQQVTEDLTIDDWKLFLSQRIPVVLTKYDAKKGIFYWEITQDYIWDTLEKEDPNWKRKKYKRIILTKELNDLNVLKDALINSQKRIIRYHSLILGIGEGIKITSEDLSDLKKHKERGLQEFKALSLIEAYSELKKGNRDKSNNILMEVYKSPKDDEAKVRAIILIIFGFNFAIQEHNEKIFHFASEGIKIAQKIKFSSLEKYLVILRSRSLIFSIIKKIGEIRIGLSIQESSKEQSFSFFYNQELIKFHDSLRSVIKDTNDALESLLDNGHISYYIAALSIILDSISLQIMQFALFDENIIKEEEKGRAGFISECEYIIKKITDEDLKKMLYSSLSNYYYLTRRNKKAIEYMQKAIDIAQKDNDKNFIDSCSKVLIDMKCKPNPYAPGKSKPIDEMTLKEYKNITQKLLELQGVPLESDDEITNAIKSALEDIDSTEHFRYCENIRIFYTNTSPLGRSIGLPSLGSKIIWCKNANEGSIEGVDLKGSFDFFKLKNCEGCEHHKPREKDWTCKVKWVKEQEEEPEFRNFLDNYRKSM